jgi:hypothetical protein
MGEVTKSPNCLNGKHGHDIGDGEIGDNGGMMFFTCSLCFERFYLVSETVMKASGLHFIPKEE